MWNLIKDNEASQLLNKLGAYALATGAALGTMTTAANAVVVSYTGPVNDPGDPRIPAESPFAGATHGWVGTSPHTFDTYDPSDEWSWEADGDPTIVYPLLLFRLDGTVLETWESDPSGGPENTLWPEAATDSVWFTREVDNWYVNYLTSVFPHDPKEDTTYFSASANASVGYAKLATGVEIGPGYDFTDGYQRGHGWPLDNDCSKHQVLNSYNGRKLQGNWFEPANGDGYIAFEIDNHYGWAHIATSADRSDVILYEFAYETIAGAPILAGDMGPEALPGDFDDNTHVDTLDIDLLCDFIRNAMPYDALYDISADGVTGGTDGVVNMLDLDYLIRFLVETTVGIGTEYGDFNLDGKIDTTDLTRLATYYGSGDTWAKGNANRYIDLVTDTTDLTILATYYGFGEPDAVPEPMTLSLLALGASGLLARRRR